MKRDADDTDNPNGKDLQRVPMHCSFCGTLLGYYSPTSHAELELRCYYCKNDYSITLREEKTSLEHKRSRKQPKPSGPVTPPA